MQLIIETPELEKQHAVNLSRWAELCEDTAYAAWESKMETDQHGNVIMYPAAESSHGSSQGDLSYHLKRLLGGRVIVECPVSTSLGVKVPDAAWCSPQRYQQAKADGAMALRIASEICVEFLSPSNSGEEMRIKRALYFEAGAEEVWLCNLDGSMCFYMKANTDTPMQASSRCPQFPATCGALALLLHHCIHPALNLFR